MRKLLILSGLISTFLSLTFLSPSSFARESLDIRALKIEDDQYKLFDNFEVMLQIVDSKKVPVRATHGRDLRDVEKELLLKNRNKGPIACALMYFDDQRSRKTLSSLSGSRIPIHGMVGDALKSHRNKMFVEFHLELTSGLSSLRCEMTEEKFKGLTYGAIEKAMDSSVSFFVTPKSPHKL